jgi:hypothetical protein
MHGLMRGFGFFFALFVLAGFLIGQSRGFVVWGVILGMVAGLVATLLANWALGRR